MARIPIAEIKKHIGQKVTAAGFVETIRNQSTIRFIILRDRSGRIQVVVSKASEEAWTATEKISLESVISVSGLAKEERQAPEGIEISAEKIEVLSRAEPELPIPISEKGSMNEAERESRMDWRWLDLRKPERELIFEVWTEMEAACREYWLANGYLEIHSPKLMSTPSESGAELFEVKYFERTAYLAQSPQFYKQMAMAAGFEKVFEIGPIFRANPSFTSRHDTEFTGFDAEISYIHSHEDVMREEENMLAFMIDRVKEKLGQRIREVYGRELITPKTPFPRITMNEAKRILAELKVPSEKEGDLNPEEERALGGHIQKKYGHEFVFVTEYPVNIRPFYHMRSESNPGLTKSFDLLWNGLEVTTGAQREHRYDVLCRQAKEKGLRLEPLEHYLNFFRYGCPPHGGMGLGPSRMVMQILGISNVREVTYLYRGVKRLTP